MVQVSIGIIFSLFGNFQYATRSNSDQPFITQFRILLADCRYGNILKRQFYTLTYPIACSSARNLTTNLLCCFGEIWSCDVGLLYYMGRTAVFWVTKIFMPVSIDILLYQIVASPWIFQQSFDILYQQEATMLLSQKNLLLFRCVLSWYSCLICMQWQLFFK